MTAVTTPIRSKPKTLDRGRLDVVNKTRSNLFNWRGQFTPEFTQYLIGETCIGNGLVVDPFCGSGTVLQECALLSRPVHGFEINPAAYAMSRFFTLCELTNEERLTLVNRIASIVGQIEVTLGDQPLFEPVEDYRQRAANLLNAGGRMFDLSQTRNERLLALLILFETEGSKVPTLKRALRSATNRVSTNLSNLPFATAPVRASLGDARSIHKHHKGDVDLILTSPPYINVFNYHQNHRALMELVGFNMLHVASSEIGSNRKNRGNRLRTVVQYALDMETCLVSMAHALAQGGQLALVVGRESNVRGLPILNSRLVAQLTEQLGCFTNEGSFERCFTNRFGVPIFEDVLLFRRKTADPLTGAARRIATEALSELLPKAPADVLVDLHDAIRVADQIDQSPIFEPSLSI